MMKNLSLIVLFYFSLCFSIFSEPISTKDSQIEIMYFCNLNGNYSFDTKGAKGITTISSLKKKEIEINSEFDKVFLLSIGNFFGNQFHTGFHLIPKVGIDAIFLTEGELKLLEVKQEKDIQNYPIFAHRENTILAPLSHILEFNGQKILISSIQNLRENIIDGENFDLTIVLLRESEILDYNQIPKGKKPIINLFIDPISPSYTFHGNANYAACNGDRSIGKISLTFREKELIRHSQQFIQLNTEKRNSAWIESDDSVYIIE